jgi:hypothetical protein
VDTFRRDSLFDFIYHGNTAVTTLDFIGDEIEFIENSYMNYYSFGRDATYVLNLVDAQNHITESAIPSFKQYCEILKSISQYLNFSTEQINQISTKLDLFYDKVDSFNINVTNALKKPSSDMAIINQWSELSSLQSEIYYLILDTITLANTEYYK